MVRDLIILGAGGSSQQIADAIEDINLREPTWNILGFLDDDPAKAGTMVNGLKVLGPIASARDRSAYLVAGMASVKDLGRREKIVRGLGLDEGRFATIIHPSAAISRHATVGLGSAIMQNVVITQHSAIGKHAIILHNVSIGHDVSIEDFVTIAPGAVIAGLSVVRKGAYIGAGSAINNARTISEGAIVGLGSVVVRDVPAGVTVVGNPARPVTPKSK